jgi:formamidopyrimidine-DNA glycosylase
VPELPEVETVVRDLHRLLVGRRIARVWVGRLALRKPWRRVWRGRVARRVETARRRGKWIVLDLDGGGRLVFHLGMTGQLTVVGAGAPIQDHTHLIFDLDDGRTQLRYRDVRRFGSVTLFSDEKDLERFFMASGLGPEPFGLDPAYWRRRLAGARRNLKAVLLDQTVVAGVGNIYADEALFEARLHPGRIAATLDARGAAHLRRAVEKVLNLAIKRRGSSIRDYVGAAGRKGAMQNEFRVYGRTGEPCPRCGGAIERVRLAGRSTHFCPTCQKSGNHQRRRQMADR